MLQGKLLACREKEFESLAEAAFKLLKEVGMKVPSETLLGYLEAYGARVDWNKQTAQFSEKVIEKTIELIKKDEKISAKSKEDNKIPRTIKEFPLDFGYETFFLYDFVTKERRRPALPEIIELIHLGDVLEEVKTVGMPVLDSNTDQAVEALEACVILLKNTKKYRSAGIRRAEQVKYFAEIDQILGYGPEKLKFVQPGRCMISPLNFGLDAARIFEEFIKCGYTKRFWVATMPISGATAPATAAGTIVLAVAEFLAGWSIAKAINPEAKVAGCVISGSLNMLTGKACFGSPEAILQDVGICQLLKKLTGVAVSFDPGYTEGKVPGLQVAYEKTFKHLALSTTLDFTLNIGALDGASAFSPVQALLDLEIGKSFWKFFAGVEVNPDTIALEEILRLGKNDWSESFLESPHTLKYCRQFWVPQFLDHTAWEGGQLEAAKEKKILEKCAEKIPELLKRYQPPEVDSKTLKAIEDVIARARNELPKLSGSL